MFHKNIENVYFIPTTDVFHPETRAIIVDAGLKYPLLELLMLSKEFGFDNLTGILILE